MPANTGLTIGKLAAAQGVSVETVRFYERKGLLPRPERGGSGFRLYSDADEWRLAFIRRAKLLGFTLSEIADLLGSASGADAEPRATDDITRAAQAKLAAISAQIAELAELQCRLRRLVRVCERGDSANCLALHLSEITS